MAIRAYVERVEVAGVEMAAESQSGIFFSNPAFETRTLLGTSKTWCSLPSKVANLSAWQFRLIVWKLEYCATAGLGLVSHSTDLLFA